MRRRTCSSAANTISSYRRGPGRQGLVVGAPDDCCRARQLHGRLFSCYFRCRDRGFSADFSTHCLSRHLSRQIASRHPISRQIHSRHRISRQNRSHPFFPPPYLPPILVFSRHRSIPQIRSRPNFPAIFFPSCFPRQILSRPYFPPSYLPPVSPTNSSHLGL